MKAIIHANIVLPESLIWDGVLLIDGGRIADFGEEKEMAVPGGTEVIDAKGDYVAPGFVDIHTHSGGSHWFFDAPLEAAKHHLQHGATSVLPALYFNLSRDEYLQSIKRIREVSQSPGGSNIKGLYMEGPYLNPKFGADAENNKWKGDISREAYMPIIEQAGSFAKIWCVAPERQGIDGFMKDVLAKIPGMVFSVAHSEASPQRIAQCLPMGLALATHHTNATGDLPKYPECRGVCVDEAVNYFDDIYAELICDSKGIHVDPFMLRLILKIKGRDRIVLISDACVFDGPVPEGYEGVTDINFDHQGEIAGSKLTLNVACRNIIKHTGAGICDVFRFASLNPAKVAKLSGVGQIQRGYDADLVFIDHRLNVNAVMQRGEMVV